MGAPKLDRDFYEIEEYFALLDDSQNKLEYVNGVIIELSGATANHNRIKEDTSGYIYSRLDDCHPLGSDMAVSVQAITSYYFPDLVYVCEEEDTFEDENETRLINPSVIIEVLSKSTEVRDRGDKFHAYWQLPSLKEYILIDSRTMRVDIFSRSEENTWLMHSYTQYGDIASIATLNVKVPLEAIYKRVKFQTSSLNS